TLPAVNTVVVAIKVPAVCPAGMVIVPGTVTKLLLLEIETSAPPAGAAILSVTVPVEELPATTEAGLIEIPDTASTAGPHWPGVPPPPHVWLGRLVQPQLSVPPQLSGVAPQDGPPEQEMGTQPPVTVSGCTIGA